MSYSREGVLMVGGASLALLAWASSRFGGGDSMLQPVMLIVGGLMMCLAALLLLLDVFQQ